MRRKNLQSKNSQSLEKLLYPNPQNSNKGAAGLCYQIFNLSKKVTLCLIVIIDLVVDQLTEERLWGTLCLFEDFVMSLAQPGIHLI